MISPGILGGIFLILGAYVLSKGYALLSLILYFFADICWFLIAFESGDYVGAISIVIGVTFSVITMLKMHLGQFHKNLKKDEK